VIPRLIDAAIITVSAALLGFVLINLILGCRTWDQTLWSETHSCIAPSDFLSLLAPSTP